MARAQISADDASDGDEVDVEVAPAAQLVPHTWWVGGLGAAIILCTAIVSPLFSIPVWQVFMSAVMSCFIAVIAVRALGETDLNPVSGVGKLSQVIFAVVAPGQVVTNLVAGAIAEAGAMQAGDLMQDLKTGHLLRASPRVQFFGQLIGATFAVFATVLVYNIYESTYGIPSEKFGAPVAYVWHAMAQLMSNGIDVLPTSALQCTAMFGVVGGLLAVIEAVCHSCQTAATVFLPSGMAWGVGMYLTADWTIPRVIGAVIEFIWRCSWPENHKRHMLMVASGFVLGEGVMSILGLVLKLFHVPTLA